MAEFRVVSVDETREWEGKFGKLVSYYLSSSDLKVFLNQKPDTPPIKPGDVLDLEVSLDTDKFKTEYRKAKKIPAKDFSGGTSLPSDKPSQEYWDKKDERITRQWAMGRALELLIANKEEGQTITVEQIAKAADEFERHVPGSDKEVPF